MEIVKCGYDYQHRKDFRIVRPGGSGDYLLLILRSPAVFVLDGAEQHTRPNSVVVYRQGTPQEYGSDHTLFVNDWVHFTCKEQDVDFLAELGIECDRVLALPGVHQLSNLVKHLCAEVYSDNPNAKQSAELYLALILRKLSDLCRQKHVMDSGLHRQLTELKSDIYTYPQRAWRIADIAKALSISPSYLQHQYKALFGTTIKQEITASRMEYGKYLLQSTDYTVSGVSQMCGYENDVHFMRLFKAQTGQTPTQYRKMGHK